jgi:iron uptake system component EfeO
MSISSPRSSQAKSSTALRLGVAAALVLMLLAGVAFYYASRLAQSQAPASSGAIVVTIGDKTCEPNALTVPAGRSTFRIVNASKRAVEWEILQGVMVVEERENIAPGFTQTLSAKLAPGDYQITCGLLSNPRGTLHVTPSSAASAEAARPSTLAYVGALAEYRVYLTVQTNALARAATAFAQAIDAGNLARAQSLYAPARAAYARLGTAAELFSDLDTRIGARADYFEKRESDPGFTGLHRLEYGLFAQHATDGLAPVASALLADIATLQSRMRGLQVPPERLARGAARVLHTLADNKTGGDEDRYSHADLAAIQGYVDGATKVQELLRPVLGGAAAGLLQTLDTDRDAVIAMLAKYRAGEGYAAFDTLKAEDRQALAGAIQAWAVSFDKINPALGLD